MNVFVAGVLFPVTFIGFACGGWWYSRALYRLLRHQLSKRIASTRVQDEDEHRRMKERLSVERRCSYMLRVLPIIWCSLSIAVGVIALNTLSGAPRWMDPLGDASAVAGWLLVVLMDFHIRRNPLVIDGYVGVFMILLCLFFVPFSPRRVEVLPMTHWAATTYRIFAALCSLSTRTAAFATQS
eukprot:SRR837773.8926.p1 GENE.SRR837773.8926~~SRR837773.8926.p1  ORF type:complete len:183 (+),score=18.42 SRR837773.8926:31-579(+)